AGGSRQRRGGEPGTGGAERLAPGDPAERGGPRHEDQRRPAAAGHDSAAPRRWSAASNASRSSGVSTTIATSAGNAALPPWTLSTRPITSAASSPARLPPPVPSGRPL